MEYDLNILKVEPMCQNPDLNFLGTWIWSYLTYRSQAVYIEGSLSSLLPLEAGVPQGSILGPIFYTIFTNELLQVVHEASCPLRQADEAALFTIQCQECVGSAAM